MRNIRQSQRKNPKALFFDYCLSCNSMLSRAYCNAMPINSFRERLVLVESSLYASWRVRSIRMVMVTALSSFGVTTNLSIVSLPLSILFEYIIS